MDFDDRGTPAQCQPVSRFNTNRRSVSAPPPAARAVPHTYYRGKKASRLSRLGTKATCRDGTGVAMKHASTRTVFDYWDQRRGWRQAPARSDIDPGDIRHVLGDTFMLAADFADDIRFRLAGTRVCTLFAREIKGELFNSLWTEASREPLEKVLAAVLSENVGGVAGGLCRTRKRSETELELLLLPLALDGRTRIRALGALAPLTPPYWLGERAVTELDLRTFRHIVAGQSDIDARRFGLAHEEPQTKHGFLIYSGGRELPRDKCSG